MKQILVVEDDRAILDVVYAFLTEAGYQVSKAENGVDAYKMFQAHKFDLLIMDIMMPKMDGYALVELIRMHNEIPILMMTARSEESDELKGFNLGADDYIRKPFSYSVFLKRIEALLKRTNQGATQNVLTCGKITMNLDTFTVMSNGVKIELTKKEFDILHLLILNQGNVIARETIFDRLWDFAAVVDTSIINTHIKNLRKKLATDKIKTIRGAGYKMVK